MVAVVAPLSRKPLGKLNIAMEQLTKPKNDFQTLKTGEVEVAMFFFFFRRVFGWFSVAWFSNNRVETTTAFQFTTSMKRKAKRMEISEGPNAKRRLLLIAA